MNQKQVIAAIRAEFEKVLEEHIGEAEHQEGVEYWDRFKTDHAAVEDFVMVWYFGYYADGDKADDKDNPVWPEDMDELWGKEFAVSCIAYREATRRYLYRSHDHNKVDRFIAHLEGYIPGIEGFRWWNPEEANKVYAEWVNGTLGI